MRLSTIITVLFIVLTLSAHSATLKLYAFDGKTERASMELVSDHGKYLAAPGQMVQVLPIYSEPLKAEWGISVTSKGGECQILPIYKEEVRVFTPGSYTILLYQHDLSGRIFILASASLKVAPSDTPWLVISKSQDKGLVYAVVSNNTTTKATKVSVTVMGRNGLLMITAVCDENVAAYTEISFDEEIGLIIDKINLFDLAGKSDSPTFRIGIIQLNQKTRAPLGARVSFYYKSQ
jgi:hypothetical protein